MADYHTTKTIKETLKPVMTLRRAKKKLKKKKVCNA